MLFLDDFLEMLEELPAELKERSDEIRRIDIDVQARLKRNREAADEFFAITGLSMTEDQKIEKYKSLQEEFSKIRALAERKLTIAKKMQDLMIKYQTHLEKEKTNFQCEMEADNSGVTGTIEKRYTDYVEATITSRKERKRKHKTASRDEASSNGTTKDDKITRILQEGTRLRMELSDDSASPSALSSSVPSPAPRGRPPKSASIMFSSAVIPTEEYLSSSTPTPQRRRSNAAALRNSVNTPLGGMNISPNVSGDTWQNISVDESMNFPGTPQTPNVPSAFSSSESRHGRPRKLTSRMQEMFKDTLQRHRNHGNSIQSLQERIQSAQSAVSSVNPAQNTSVTEPPPQSPLPNDVEGDDEESGSDDGEDSRRWCFCHEKSYGEMVACDNKSCPYMWFHYPCVNMNAPPKGKWYCPYCVNSLGHPTNDEPKLLTGEEDNKVVN